MDNECYELYSTVKPYLVAELGAPNPCKANIYDLVKTIAENVETNVSSEGTVLVDGPNTAVTGDGGMTHPYRVTAFTVIDNTTSDGVVLSGEGTPVSPLEAKVDITVNNVAGSGVLLSGEGNSVSPLEATADIVVGNVVGSGVLLSGNGTSVSPLEATADIVTNNPVGSGVTLSGNGTSSSPLEATADIIVNNPVGSGVTLSGNGTSSSPLTATSSSIGSQLQLLPGTALGLTGTGTSLNPYILSNKGVVPNNTVYVSPIWPNGVDTTDHFTTINSALSYILSVDPTPSSTSTWTVLVNPGVYSESINLVSNVNIVGLDAKSSVISGSITYIPGSGVNLSNIANIERVQLYNITVDSITYNATAKSGVLVDTYLNIISSYVTSDISVVFSTNPARVTLDVCNISRTVVNAGSISVINYGNFYILYSYVQTSGTISFQTNTVVRISNSTYYSVGGVVVIGPGNVVTLTNTTTTGDITVSDGGILYVSNCQFDEHDIITCSDSSSRIELMNSQYDQTQLAGPGPIDREIYQFSISSDSNGSQTYTFAIPYTTSNYQVIATYTSSTGSAVFRNTAKTSTSFTWNVGSSGASYDITILLRDVTIPYSTLYLR